MAEGNDLSGGNDVLRRPEFDGDLGRLSNKEIMAEARSSLSGNWGLAIVAYILYGVFILSLTLFFFSSVLFVGLVSGMSGADAGAAVHVVSIGVDLFEFLISGAITVGFCSFFLGIVQEDTARLENLFTGFRRFWKSFAIYFFYGLFVFLWSLLLIIPGIIAAYRYAMVFYAIADDEECGPLEAMERSKEMMKGKKWTFFCLQCRFIGWAILCTLIPFGWLWLIPYMQTSFARFYEEVR